MMDADSRQTAEVFACVQTKLRRLLLIKDFLFTVFHILFPPLEIKPILITTPRDEKTEKKATFGKKLVYA